MVEVKRSANFQFALEIRMFNVSMFLLNMHVLCVCCASLCTLSWRIQVLGTFPRGKVLLSVILIDVMEGGISLCSHILQAMHRVEISCPACRATNQSRVGVVRWDVGWGEVGTKNER